MSEFAKNKLIAVLKRAGRTFLQCAISIIGVDSATIISKGMTFADVNWGACLATAAFATLISLAMNVLQTPPEVTDETGGGKITFHNTEE